MLQELTLEPRDVVGGNTNTKYMEAIVAGRELSNEQENEMYADFWGPPLSGEALEEVKKATDTLLKIGTAQSQIINGEGLVEVEQEESISDGLIRLRDILEESIIDDDLVEKVLDESELNHEEIKEKFEKTKKKPYTALSLSDPIVGTAVTAIKSTSKTPDVRGYNFSTIRYKPLDVSEGQGLSGSFVIDSFHKVLDELYILKSLNLPVSDTATLEIKSRGEFIPGKDRVEFIIRVDNNAGKGAGISGTIKKMGGAIMSLGSAGFGLVRKGKKTQEVQTQPILIENLQEEPSTADILDRVTKKANNR